MAECVTRGDRWVSGRLLRRKCQCLDQHRRELFKFAIGEFRTIVFISKIIRMRVVVFWNHVSPQPVANMHGMKQSASCFLLLG